jgi:HD-GYP domain-containing protein (c-di-GMP phosphodiesterase class II)
MQQVTIEEQAGPPLAASEQVVAALSAAQAERTPQLDKHTYDVAELAVAVGRRAGLDSQELGLLAQAAELHDIGKLAIPDSIMEKPGPLNEDELALARLHPVIGERIIAAAPDLGPVAAIVRSSHEHYDGSGYPDGLAGDEIPRLSRIILVCDAFCAMTRPRPFSSAVSPREALLELRRCAGAQFDPAIVTAFRQTLAEGGPGPADAACLTAHRRRRAAELGERAVGSGT